MTIAFSTVVAETSAEVAFCSCTYTPPCLTRVLAGSGIGGLQRGLPPPSEDVKLPWELGRRIPEAVMVPNRANDQTDSPGKVVARVDPRRGRNGSRRVARAAC